MMGDAVVVAGLLLGALMVVSACWVWIRHQKFGTAGAVLCLSGVVLVGLSVYSRVSFKVGGIEAELEAKVEKIAQRTELASEGVLELADQVNASQRQFVALADALEEGEPVSRTRLEEIAAPVEQDVERRPEALRDLTILRERGELAIDPARPALGREVQRERPGPG